MPQKRQYASNAERATAAIERLKESGGARKTFSLSADALSALARLKAARPGATETEIVEALLIDAAR